MKNETEIKELVREKYSQIASQSNKQNAISFTSAEASEPGSMQIRYH